MIYLDNSSTTHKKPFGVVWSQLMAVTKFSINPSRAGYKRAQLTGEKVFKCRELFAETFVTCFPKILIRVLFVLLISFFTVV